MLCTGPCGRLGCGVKETCRELDMTHVRNDCRVVDNVHRRRVLIGPTRPLMLISTIEHLLNRGLPRSPRARALCAELAGRSVALEIRDIATVRVASDGSVLTLTAEPAPDA